jgi:hypothetical protein
LLCMKQFPKYMSFKIEILLSHSTPICNQPYFLDQWGWPPTQDRWSLPRLLMNFRHRIGRYSRSVTQASICPRSYKQFVVNLAILASTTGTLYLPKPDKNFRLYYPGWRGRKTIKEPTQVTLLLYFPILCFRLRIR